MLHDGSVFVAVGGDWFWGKNETWLHRVNPDANPGTTTQTNRVWFYALGRHTMSTPVAANGTLYVETMTQLYAIQAK